MLLDCCETIQQHLGTTWGILNFHQTLPFGSQFVKCFKLGIKRYLIKISMIMVGTIEICKTV